MRLSLVVLLCIPLISLAQEPPPIAPTDAKTPAEELKLFKLPAGFECQLVASEPDIGKPMQCAFDAKGRLWVTSSRLYPFPAEPGKATDKIFILSDFAPDGKARKIEVFADNLNIPIGILPLPDCKSCIVSSVGQILKLTDADGDGKADKTEVLFTGFGTRDTHGMTNSYTLMPDGWVYACHGYLNDSRVKGKDGHEIHMQSGHTFRFRPDGSRIEIYTHGQVNPFGIAVDPWFNLYTADCHTKPITQLIPGAWYDSFGKPHDGLGYAPHVTRHAHGSTALCGLTWYDADQFPPEYKGTMFLGNVVTNRINFDKIEWKGSTPVGIEQPDFLVSGDPWFRPTDIKLGPDGALYVTDFYNKIIGHYEVDLRHPGRDKDRGRVWRIVWKGLDGKAKPPEMPFKDLTNESSGRLENVLLTNPGLCTRLLALQEIMRRGAEFQIQPFSSTPTPTEFSTAAIGWWSERYSPGLKPGIREELPHSMILHAIKMVSIRQNWDDELRKQVVGQLSLKPVEGTERRRWSIARAATEALSVHPHPDNIKPLLAFIPTIPAEDTHLKYAARLALRNSLQKVEDWAKADFPSNDPVIADVALGIPTAQAAHYAANVYQLKLVPQNRTAEFAQFIGRRGTSSDWSVVAKTKIGSNVDTIRAFEAALRGLQASGYKDERGDLLRNVLGVHDLISPNNTAESRAYVACLKQAAGLIPNSNQKSAAEKCSLLFHSATDGTLRAEAFEALALYDRAAALELARKHILEPETPAPLRERVVTALAASRATVDQALLIDTFKNAPYKLATVIATGLARDKVGADLLFVAIKAGQASPRLLQEQAVLSALKAAKVPNADARVAELTKGLPSPDARLAAIIKDRTAGYAKAKPDVAAGKVVFTKNCAACHQIANEGGKIAPNLDGIGARGLDRLLEDVLDPNRNVDANFRATRFDTTDGRTITGLLRQIDGDVFVLADSEGKEIRLPKGAVDKQTQLTTSPMPADVAEKLKEQELYDLMGYLLSQKVK
jgi:putative heme-binding domain-containing protein